MVWSSEESIEGGEQEQIVATVSSGQVSPVVSDEQQLEQHFAHIDMPPEVHQALLSLGIADRQAILNSPEIRELPGKLDAAMDIISSASPEQLASMDAKSLNLPSAFNNVIAAAIQQREEQLAAQDVIRTGLFAGASVSSSPDMLSLAPLAAVAATTAYTPPASAAYTPEKEEKQNNKGGILASLLAFLGMNKEDESAQFVNAVPNVQPQSTAPAPIARNPITQNVATQAFSFSAANQNNFSFENASHFDLGNLSPPPAVIGMQRGTGAALPSFG